MNLEIITMRSDISAAETAIDLLSGIPASEDSCIHVYRRIDVPGDISIHIIRNDAGRAGNSVVGERIISELKHLGVIQYSEWTEQSAAVDSQIDREFRPMIQKRQLKGER